MQEDFLHYIWQYKKFDFATAETASGEPVLIIDGGTINTLSGPDFFNARMKIGDQLWAGNVEIHINSSDWYLHGHETDVNYDNVILHVVWNHDADIYRKDNSVIPVLELKDRVDESSFHNYDNLVARSSGNWINCEKDFSFLDSFHVDNWLDRMYIERLQEKSTLIFQMLEKSSNDWEEVLFRMLAKNFGLNVNGEAFLNMANSVNFPLIRKLNDQQLIEALLMGQAGMLEEEVEETYYQDLQKKYHFLKLKYKLNNVGSTPVKYFRLRPHNFPTIRLAQLAALYSKKSSLFAEAIRAGNREDYYKIFEVKLPEFWETHYTFRKAHASKKKPLTASFIDLLIINALVPLKFCYAQKQGRDLNEEIISLMSVLKKESNEIIRKFSELRPEFENALQSQALLQLKKQYCDKNLCLKCGLGIKLLQRKIQI